MTGDWIWLGCTCCTEDSTSQPQPQNPWQQNAVFATWYSGYPNTFSDIAHQQDSNTKVLTVNPMSELQQSHCLTTTASDKAVHQGAHFPSKRRAATSGANKVKLTYFITSTGNGHFSSLLIKHFHHGNLPQYHHHSSIWNIPFCQKSWYIVGTHWQCCTPYQSW